MKIFVMLVLALMVGTANAQSEETLKHAATMEAIGKLADAMKAMAEANAQMAARAGAQVQPVYQPPKDVECTGFMNCTVAGFKGLFGAVKDVAGIGVQVAGPLMAYRTAVKQYDFQKVAAEQTTKQVESQQGTLQYAFGAQRDVAVAGFNQPNPPTTAISASGPVNVGGTQTNTTGSYNPTNPSPKVCVPTFGATGQVTGYTCSGG